MVSFKRKSQAQAFINLSPRLDGHICDSRPDHFLSTETVAGDAHFTLPPGSKFSHSKITLKGSVRTTTEDTPIGALSKGWRTEKLPFLGVLFESKTQTPLEGDERVTRVPFKFELNACERLAAFVSSLPPSVDAKEEGQRSSDPQYEVSYSITATAYSNRGLLATVVQQIFIHPVSLDYHSDSSSDVPGEYFWAIKGLGRSQSLRSLPKGPIIELAGQEPSPIVLHAGDINSEGATEVPFVVKLLPQAGDKLDEDYFPKQCKAKAHLISKTHMVPDGINSISKQNGLEYIKIEGKTTTKVQQSYQQTHDLIISHWERSLSDPVEPFVVARFALMFRLERGKLPLPSFHTPILSRRYLIDMILSFDGSDQIFKLSIPCEVIHGAPEHSLDAHDLLDNKTRSKSDASQSERAQPWRRLTAP